MMGVISDFNVYLKWITTTDMTMEQLSSVIRDVEFVKSHYDHGLVVIEVTRKGVKSIGTDKCRNYTNGNGGNGNHGDA